jgi:fatty-acyl-CoA synthase
MSATPAAPVNFGVGSWIERRARIAPAQVALVGGDPAFLESLFASGLLGAALAPVNHRLAADGIRAVLADTEPSVLMQHGATDPTPMPGSVRHRISVAGSLEEALDFEALVAESSDEPIQGLVGMEDVCLLSHTSGTTGPPKGVMLTHANLTWNVVNFLTCADFRRDDVTVAIAPFFRVGGTGVNVLPVLFLGGTVVVPGDLSPDGILQAMDRHRVTVGFGNPDLLDALARSEVWPRVDLSCVRFVITGGAPVPERLIRAYLNRGVTLLQGYGLSEAAPLALLLDPHSALSRVGSAREVLSPDGWLRTGDAARSDEEGYVWIVDRVADHFLSEGQPVYPGDVERVLTGHSAVVDAGVVQVLDRGDGEAVAAVVVPSAGSKVTEREILAFGREHLAAHQAPASVTFVDHLPRNSVGKLLRAQLRELASPPDRT